MIRPKVRVSQLAGELRCKANEILEALPGLGVTRPKALTHNSRLEAQEADKVRAHFTANPDLKESKVDSVTLGRAKAVAHQFGEEI